MTKQNDAIPTDYQFVQFAREEQRIFGHTGLEEEDCPPELLAADRAFVALSSAEQRKRKWDGVCELSPHLTGHFPA